jgi:hypothetical protein
MSVSDQPARKTNGADADGEVVWSWRAHAGAKLALMRRITRATVANKLVHRGEHEGNR